MVSTIVAFLKLYLVFQYFSLIFFIIFFPLFKSLSDRGYFLAKISGLAIFAYGIWAIGIFKILPFTKVTVWGALFFVSLFSLIILLRKRDSLLQFLIKEKKYLLVGESIFMAVSLFFGLIRSTGTGFTNNFVYYEDSMDFSILNFLTRTDALPPQDPWFVGSNLNYYYFGHLIFATLAKISSLPNEIIYPLSLGFIAGLIAILLYGLFFNFKKAVMPGLISLILFFSVPPNFLRIFFEENSLANQYVIFSSHYLYKLPFFTEYPLYTYSVASLHASAINLALFSGLLILYWALLKEASLASSIMIGLFLTISFMTSSWDIFILVPILILIFLFKGRLQNLPLILIFAFTFIFPYLKSYQGMGLIIQQTRESLQITPTLGFQFGFFALFLLVNIFSLKKWWVSFDAARRPFFLALLILSVGIVLFPFFFYLFNLNDTFFKFYFILWLLLSIVTAQVIWLSITASRTRILRNVNLALLFLVAISSLLFFYSYKINYSNGVMQRYAYFSLRPSDKQAIKWINENITGTPTILEVYTKDFSEANRISSFTGLPTLVGWTYQAMLRGHNNSEINTRRQIEAMIYNPNVDATLKKEIVLNHKIRYIYFGELEKSVYGKDSLESLKKLNLLKIVYSSTDVTLLQVQ